MNHIVITSINLPTEAVKSFANLNDHRLIVVGDKKTPKSYSHPGVNFISVADQEKLDYKLNEVLPYNHYSRKMLGYLSAIENGALGIIDTDDDNIPYENWGFPDFSGQFDALDENMGFVNIYKAFTDQEIWPRGLPLKLIKSGFNPGNSISKQSCKVGIWQGLADEDPDVDAIYRLTSDHPCYFNKRAPIVCKKGTLSPFNTQNTLVRKELFPLLYLPSHVTFRYTDILRGFVAQPIMWIYGFELGFTQASVIQKRNPHDYFKDFISEIPMYETTEKVIDIISQIVSSSMSIEDNLYAAYTALYKDGIVVSDELKVLEAWLTDIKKIL